MTETLRTPITNVGDLRRATAGLPDDQQVLIQVIALDHTAWQLYGEFFSLIPNHTPPTSLLYLSHPELKTLPK